MPNVHKLSEPKIEELSLIFGSHKGQEWAPRNPGATVLGMKGAAIGSPAVGAALQPNSFISQLIETFKGKSTKGWLVNDDQPDNVDGDGDGGQDYEQLVDLVTSVSSDLQQCFWINDDDARSMAIATALDNFKKNLDDIYSGGDGKVTRKAGARHSKADSDHIAAIGDAAQKAADAAKASSDAADSIKTHVDALNAKADDSKTGDGGTDDGMGDDDAKKAAAKGTADAEAAAAAAKAGTVSVPIVARLDTGVLEATKAALAEATTEIRTMLDAQRVDVTKALADQSTAFDAKLDERLMEVTTKASEQVSAVKASVNAIVGAARAPGAPGGLSALEPDGSRKGAPILGNETANLPEIKPTDSATGPNGAIRKLLNAQRT